MSKKNLRWATNLDAERYLGRAVKINGNVIEVKKGSLGLNKLSAVDYLCSYHMYVVKYI